MISAFELSKIIRAEIIGDGTVQLVAPNRMEMAQAGEVTFVQHAKYARLLPNCKASVIITLEEFVDESLPFTWLVVKRPEWAFAKALEVFYPTEQPIFQNQPFFAASSVQIGEKVQIGFGTYLGENVKIGDYVVLYPQVYIGNDVQIGSGTVIFPGVKILDKCEVGKDCIIHAGVVIGADGFGFVADENHSYHKIPQKGNVVIRDQVEIGANTCIDRAVVGATIIEKGVKIDNLVQIGHNVSIEMNTVIAAQTGIAGSCQIGPRNRIGGQAGFAPHVKTASDVEINAQSGVSKSVLKPGSVLTATPAEPYMEYYRKKAFWDQLQGKIQKLELEIMILKNKPEKP